MVNKNLIVHAWQLDGLARLHSSFINKLENKIKGRLYKDVALESGLPSPGSTIGRILRRGKKKNAFTKVSSIFKLTDYLKIPHKEVEENIKHFKISSSVEWENLKIYFPLEINPLWFRCVGVGDFSCSTSGWRYSIYWHQNSTKPMRNLIDKLIGLVPKYRLGGYSGKNERILIPSILVDAICVLLNISRKETKTERFILASLRLPKPYRLQILTQTIVDDGYCDKIHSRISIHMKDKKIIEALHMLCGSLGYKTKIVIRNTGHYKNNEFYDLIFDIVSTHKFYEDLKLLMKKYGKLAGLWNKQKRLEEIIKAISVRVNVYQNKQRILTAIKQRGVISSRELKKITNIRGCKLQDYLMKLKKEGLVKNIKHGIYALK